MITVCPYRFRVVIVIAPLPQNFMKNMVLMKVYGIPIRNHHGDITDVLNYAYNYFLVNLPLFWFASIFATIFEMILIEVKKIVKPLQFISIFFIFSIFTYLYFFPSFLFFIFFVPVAIYNGSILYPIIKAIRKKKIKLKI
jgi:hypothetical protein